MAMTTNRINGTCSLGRGYSFYANVLVWDAVNEGNTFTVMVNTYLVNGGTRTDSSGWTKNITINNVGYETLTSQRIKTDTVDRYGGEVLVQSKSFEVPITMSSINVSAYASKSSYTQYDPGYCSLNGNVSMPKVASTWSSSLLSIPNIASEFTLPINKYVSSYYNVVEVRNSNNTILVKTINDAVNGTSVTFSSSELNTIYTMDNNANQLPLRFFMDLITYTNSSKTTQIGTTQRLTCEAYLVGSEPTTSISVEEQDTSVIALLGSSTSTKIIKNASDLLFTITATAKNGATISSVKINDKNATLDSGSYKLNTTDITTGTFNIITTDSRGITKEDTITKTLLDYIKISINSNWTIARASQVSSDLVLNAVINCYSSTIDGNTNTPTVQYSLDNENWATISSSSYTFQDNKITISNLTLSNLVNYKQVATFYLKATDLLSTTQDNRQIAKGIETFSYGETDLQVNGDLILCDEDGENPIKIHIGKLLWSGTFTSGEITVDGISSYSVIAVVEGSVICFGTKYFGLGGFGEYGTYGIGTRAYRFGVNGDTLTIDNNNKGGTNGTSQEAITAIYGVF